MLQSHDVFRLAVHQVRRASEVMGRAFQRDPMWEYLVPDETRRARLLPSSFGILVRYSLRFGEVYTTASLDGVACWLTPGNTTPSFGRLLQVSVRGAPLGMGWTGLRRYTTIAAYIETVHKRIAPGPHWYLWGIGVEPARQHRGIGAQLMRPMVANAEEEGLPCYLETANELNVPFYQRHGFSVMSEGEVPGCGLRIWAMLREPHEIVRYRT